MSELLRQSEKSTRVCLVIRNTIISQIERDKIAEGALS